MATEARQIEAGRQRRVSHRRARTESCHRRSDHRGRHYRSSGDRPRCHLARRSLIGSHGKVALRATATGGGVYATPQKQEGRTRCTGDRQHIAVVIGRDRRCGLRSCGCSSRRNRVIRCAGRRRRRSGRIGRSAGVRRACLRDRGGRSRGCSTGCCATRRRGLSHRTGRGRRGCVDYGGRGGKGDDRRARGGRRRWASGLCSDGRSSRRGGRIARALLKDRGGVFLRRRDGWARVACTRRRSIIRRNSRRR